MMAIRNQSLWLFSPSIDLSVFLGSALLSFLLLAVGWKVGVLNAETPDWAWISTVLLVDVAHVWATSFRVYFDTEELKRRLLLYLGVPIAGYIIGVAIYSESEILFWRILALIAIFHFVRQQYGWVMLYRRKLGESDRIGFLIDASAVYLATIYPLVFWMSNLPRNFQWFVENDFFALPSIFDYILFPFYILSLLIYFSKSVYLYITKRFVNIGKDIIVLTTATCWYVGIVALNSDYAFTVTNVLIHGIPYFAIVYFYAKSRRDKTNSVYRFLTSNWIVFLATLWALAYVEELLWHRNVWHERDWLFGENWNVGSFQTYLVPLLAVPQISHYILDAFIWRKKDNPNLSFI
ncbi:MAG: hypothetical protein N2Z23_04345 [Pyrinomonadaceae bacterium]|nr:hypothetical protein [Pyrinomonadaceae bacterium]MCX7639654.1 hypothetical protein [Pyrinomonadaceae bacterium]MDW8303328.1 hypothetical protein [Acidobacteriota bacterium]